MPAFLSLALASLAVAAPGAVMSAGGAAPASTATRLSGAAMTVTVRARIVRDAAAIGARFGAPGPRMIPRAATVTAADGRPVPALVYNFE